MNGVTTTVKVAHVRLCHSRMMFVRAYPRETQEMVFDAHDRAFAFFRGACQRGIYDNMKTAVETVFVGKDRQYNRRFLQMCSHYLVEPVACTPASGWEKGQVESQVGLVRERFFTPRLKVKSYDELNAWLVDKCLAWAKAHAHPEQSERTIWRLFLKNEKHESQRYRIPFDSFHIVPASVSKLCLVRFDNNHYSVNASAVGRAVEIQTYADRVVIRQDGRVVAEHPRKFGRGETAYDPWHYFPVFAPKPGALRNGAPFKDWVLPAALDRVRRKLAGSNDGDRQMVKILAAVLSDGLSEVEASLLPSARRGRPFRRRRPQHSGASPPTAGPGADRHAGVAGASPTADRRLRPLRQPQERLTVERTEILDMMGELKLFGMRAAYDETLATALKRSHEPQRLVGDLLRAEISEKQARSIKYQLAIAKLPLAKDIDDFAFKGTPINEGLVRDLARGGFLALQRNTVFIGGTGTGNTPLAIAIARS